jgi:hypothetical protein
MAGMLWLCGCHGAAHGNGVPPCDAPEVQEAAQAAAAQAVKIPFALSSFTEVTAESTDTKRQCRVRAKHAASGAAIWMKFTVAKREGKPGKPPADDLAVAFAPIE